MEDASGDQQGEFENPVLLFFKNKQFLKILFLFPELPRFKVLWYVDFSCFLLNLQFDRKTLPALLEDNPAQPINCFLKYCFSVYSCFFTVLCLQIDVFDLSDFMYILKASKTGNGFAKQ